MWFRQVNAYVEKAWCGWLGRWCACWLQPRAQCPLARAMYRPHCSSATGSYQSTSLIVKRAVLVSHVSCAIIRIPTLPFYHLVNQQSYRQEYIDCSGTLLAIVGSQPVFAQSYSTHNGIFRVQSAEQWMAYWYFSILLQNQLRRQQLLQLLQRVTFTHYLYKSKAKVILMYNIDLCCAYNISNVVQKKTKKT